SRKSCYDLNKPPILQRGQAERGKKENGGIYPSGAELLLLISTSCRTSTMIRDCIIRQWHVNEIAQTGCEIGKLIGNGSYGSAFIFCAIMEETN
ncbi:hypothetical protein AMECASPLE_037697, partial [Ameca splendens]